MPYQEYYYQDPTSYQQSRLNSSIRQWRQGPLETFWSAVSESHSEYTALGWLERQARESYAPNTTPILKEEWNQEHYLWRDDIPWKDDLTIGVAEIRRDRSDYLAEQAIKRANVDFWSLPNLSGSILGAMGSPENLVVWGGMVGRSAALTKLAQTTRIPLTSRFLKPVVQGMADAAIADTLYQTVKATVQLNRGENIDATHAAFELGLATLTGGIIGTFPMAYQIAKKVPSAFRPALIKKAMDDIAQSRPVSRFKNLGKRTTEEEMNPDEIKNAINERINSYKDETNEMLLKDASKEGIKDYAIHTLTQAKKLVKVIANCLRRSKS